MLNVAPAPPGLGPNGIALWDTIQREFRIDDAGGRILLAEIAAARDMVQRLSEEIDRVGLTIEAPSGRRANPMLKDLLGHRAFISAGLKRLGILDQPLKPFGGQYKYYPV
jgi:hypothetical protein